MIFIWNNGGQYSDRAIWIVEAPAEARPLFDEPRLGGFRRSTLVAVFDGAPEWLNGSKPSDFTTWLDLAIDQGCMPTDAHEEICDIHNFKDDCTCSLKPMLDLAKRMRTVLDLMKKMSDAP